jgi:uncharacterized protein (DUF924 family)
MNAHPPVSLDQAIRIAADAMPRESFRPALLVAIRTDPQVRDAIRAAVAAGREP